MAHQIGGPVGPVVQFHHFVMLLTTLSKTRDPLLYYKYFQNQKTEFSKSKECIQKNNFGRELQNEK